MINLVLIDAHRPYFITLREGSGTGHSLGLDIHPTGFQSTLTARGATCIYLIGLHNTREFQIHAPGEGRPIDF